MKISVLFIFLMAIFACKSPSQDASSDYDPSQSGGGVTQNLYAGDTTSSPFDFSFNSSQLVSGMPGYLKLNGISGIKGFNAWGAFPAFVFTEKNGHQVWLIVNYGTGWTPIKIGGIPEVPGSGASGVYSWFNTPLDVERYFDGSSEHFYVTDSENKAIREITTDAGFNNYAVTTFASLSYRPVGITRGSDGTFYVTTKEGVVLSINSSGVVSEIKTGLGFNLYGITVNGSILYLMNGDKLYSMTTAGASYAEVSISGISLSGEPNFKNIRYFNNKLYISDTASNCIFSVNTDGSSGTVFAGQEGVSGDNIGSLTDSKFQAPFGLGIDTDNNILYIADGAANNIKKISSMDSSPSQVEKIPLETSSSSFLYDPLGITISPGGEFLYVASSNNYQVKQVQVETGNVIQEISFSGSPFGVWDVKVVQEKTTTGEMRDRYLFAVESHKTSGYGRIVVYDLIKQNKKVLYDQIQNLGAYGTALTLNENGTRIYFTSRELSQGLIYQAGVTYNSETGEVSPSQLEPSIFLRKSGYFPLGIGYLKDSDTQAIYLLVTAVEGSNIFVASSSKVSRFEIQEGRGQRGDIEPVVSEILYDFWNAAEGTDALYPRYMAVAGKYVYFTENKTGRVFRLNGAGSAGQTAVEVSAAYQSVSLKPFGIAVDGIKQKVYLSSDANDVVISN